MIDSASERIVVEPRKRRREIEQCLAARGLGPSGRRANHQDTPRHDEIPRIEHLRNALEQLGPVFAAFGQYLSTRVDLAPLRDCLALAATRSAADPLGGARVDHIIGEAVAKPADQIFLHFESDPFESNLSFQSHHARFPDGTPVTVKITDPDLADRIDAEIPFLAQLKDTVASLGWYPFSFDAIVDDFSRSAHRLVSRGEEATMLGILFEDTRDFEALKIPAVFEDYTSDQVLTIERLPGWPLDAVAPSRHGTHGEMHPQMNLEASTLARRLCFAWLRQALYGRFYPLNLVQSDITALPADKLAWSGGSFTSMPSASKENVWHYLNAAANRNPDRAYDHLIQEMEEESRATGEEALRNRLRQVVPFRDGSWHQSGNADTMAEHLFVHWRLAREHGFHPRIHMLDFYRSMFAVTATAQRLAPGHDSLREALQELRMSVGMGEIRDMMNPEMWRETMEQYVGSVIELPRKLDEVLLRARNGDLVNQLRQTVGPPTAPKNSRMNAVIGLVGLMVATVIISRQMSEIVENPLWVERAGTVVFALCCIMLFRILSRNH